MSQSDSPPFWTAASNRPDATYSRPNEALPMRRAMRISGATLRSRAIPPRPMIAMLTTKSPSDSFAEACTVRPLRFAGPSAVAA